MQTQDAQYLQTKKVLVCIGMFLAERKDSDEFQVGRCFAPEYLKNVFVYSLTGW